MTFIYTPLDKKHNDKGGSAKEGSAIKFTVYTDNSCVNLIVKNDKSLETAVYPLDRVDGGFSVVLKGLKKGLYFYHFESDGYYFGKDDFLNAKKYIIVVNVYIVSITKIRFFSLINSCKESWRLRNFFSAYFS